MKWNCLLSPLLAASLMPLAQADPLDEARFQELHDQLQPGPDEAWRQLPWHLSLLEARARAVEEKKPVYMLVRSGHPLGCV